MIEIRKTKDGSHTLFVPELNEHYHSSFGAVQESLHVFIHAGLHYFNKPKQRLSIFEAGFGTGLNALLTLQFMADKSIKYTSVEAYPVDDETILKLNYPELCDFADAGQIFSKLHQARWDVDTKITSEFVLKKIRADIRSMVLPKNEFDLIYYDAFAPNVQPELWTEEIFAKLFSAMSPGGILVTYSSKGLVKQNLRKSGFEVQRLTGPPGKRHILRASKAHDTFSESGILKE